jgi:hypothetical protein
MKLVKLVSTLLLVYCTLAYASLLDIDKDIALMVRNFLEVSQPKENGEFDLHRVKKTLQRSRYLIHNAIEKYRVGPFKEMINLIYGQLPHLKDEELEVFALVPLAVNYYVNTKLKFAQFSDSLESIYSDRLGIDFQHIPEAFCYQIRTLIDNYYDNMPFEIKRKILISILTVILDSETRSGDAFEMQITYSFLRASGPGLQKLFQLLGNDIRNPQFQTLVRNLQHNLPPMTPNELKRQLNRIFVGGSFRKLFTKFNLTSISAA